MANKIQRECKGCRINYRCVLEPHCINGLGNKEECPCQICLIKGICEKVCTAFLNYSRYILNKHLHERAANDK